MNTISATCTSKGQATIYEMIIMSTFRTQYVTNMAPNMKVVKFTPFKLFSLTLLFSTVRSLKEKSPLRAHARLLHMPPYIYSLKVTTIHTHSYNFWRTKTIHIHYSVICDPFTHWNTEIEINKFINQIRAPGGHIQITINCFHTERMHEGGKCFKLQRHYFYRIEYILLPNNHRAHMRHH
jgi:hypothetical protein